MTKQLTANTASTVRAPMRRRMHREYTVRRHASPLPPRDRPREKLQANGRGTLADHELVALIVGHGQRGRSALDLGTSILEATGGIHGLARTSAVHLARLDGVGGALAARLLAAVELGRRTLERPAPERQRFTTPRDLADFLIPRYGAHPVEQFGLVLLDARHQLIRDRVLMVGGQDAVTAPPREIFREALAAGAAGVVVFHNHPTGDPTPSPEDVRLTERLIQAGRVLGVELVDHLVIADSRYFSMREFGALV